MNRKDKKRRAKSKQRRSNARARATANASSVELSKADLEPGIASDFITFGRIKPGDKVFIAARESNHKPAKSESLKNQLRFLSENLKLMGAEIVGSRSKIANGCLIGKTHHWATWLEETTKIALSKDAEFLVMDTLSRFVRNPDYHSANCPNARPRHCDLVELSRRVSGLIMATLSLHPDASNAEEESWHKRRGQLMSNNKPGPTGDKKPGWAKERRERHLLEVLWLLRSGDAPSLVSRDTGIPLKTIREWWRKHRDEVAGFSLEDARTNARKYGDTRL